MSVNVRGNVSRCEGMSVNARGNVSNCEGECQ